MDGIRSLTIATPPAEAVQPAGKASGVSFADELGKAIQGTESLQQVADSESQKLALGQGNLHEAALALEKADISLRVLTKVRNKLVEAYQDVMRMGV